MVKPRETRRLGGKAGQENQTPQRMAAAATGEPEPQQDTDISFKAETGLGNNEPVPLGLLHPPEIPIWPVPTDRPTRHPHGLEHRIHGPRRPKVHILEEDLAAFTSMITPAPVLYERDDSGEPGGWDVDTQDGHGC